MSSIFKWMIVLVLLIAVAGGAGAYWYLARSDDVLRIEVLKHLAEMAPDLKFTIERANFDFSGRVRLHGAAVQLPGDVEPSLYVPEMIISLDQDLMTDFKTISIRQLQFVHPQLRAVRQSDGRWNWQGFDFHCKKSNLLPHVEVQHGTIVVELQREQGGATKLKLADLNATSAPAAARKIAAVISTRIEPAGPLSATVELDLDSKAYSVEAKWLKLSFDDERLAQVSEFSPQVEAALNRARQMMADLAAKQVASTPIRPAKDPSGLRPYGQDGRFAPKTDSNPASMQLQSNVFGPARTMPASFGVKCDCDLHVKLKSRKLNEPLSYEVLTEIRSGQISNQLLPFPLYEIQGSVFADARRVIFRDFRAENGATRLFVNGELAANQSPTGKLQVRNLVIDDPLKVRLPESLRKLVNSMSLTGVCDIDLGTMERNGTIIPACDFRISQGAVSHERFQYPIRDITGIVRLRGTSLQMEGEGKASGVPITVVGKVTDIGPAHEADFRIEAKSIPINSTLIEACSPSVQKAMIELAAQGEQDIRMQIARPAGIGQKYSIRSESTLKNCSCNFKGFPYRITRIFGRMFATDETITFEELKGQHDGAEITASGTFQRIPAPGRLDLTITAVNAAFDRSLEVALPASVHRIWDELHPVGRFDVETQISWIPGQPCRIVLPKISVSDSEIMLRGFQWSMQSVRGEFAYDAPRLIIKSVTAQHDDTQLHGRGIADFVPGQPWRIRFDELHVDDLVPNSTFRKALPPQLRKVCETLQPTGKFSIETVRPDRSNPGRQKQGFVEFSGGGDTIGINSAWDVQVILAECGLTAGLRMDDLHGRIDLAGTTDSRGTTMTGQLDLDSVSIFRQPSGQVHQISRVVGPIKLQNGEFIAGSRVRASPSSERVSETEEIKADVIDGKLTLNAVANLQNEPDYKVFVGLSRGRLETYAQQYLRGQSNLAGIMNGWMFLWGKGSTAERIHGRGNLQIRPAALYELPVFVQIFRVLDAGDRTAFDQADLVFNIENSRFNFETIDLVGPISLEGRGFVRFDGPMQLDFKSTLARNRLRIPIIHEIAGALSRGWVGVKVTGSVGAPETRTVPIPEIEDAFKQFLGSFEPQSQRPAPRQMFPGAGRAPN